MVKYYKMSKADMSLILVKVYTSSKLTQDTICI